VLRCDSTGDRPQRCDMFSETSDATAWVQDLSWLPRARVVNLPDFSIDEHEVTNAQYRFCVEFGVCSRPASDRVNGVKYFEDPDFDDHPVVQVTRQQAREYCQFLGKDLPTEAQWARAARLGPDKKEMRTFPWSGVFDSGCARGADRFAVTSDCASLPQHVRYSEQDRTALLVRNMASNVAEWVLDGWDQYALCDGKSGYDSACQRKGSTCKTCEDDKSECAIYECLPKRLSICKAGAYAAPPASSTALTGAGVIRGGDYMHDKCFHRLYVRRKAQGAPPYVGFRCARKK